MIEELISQGHYKEALEMLEDREDEQVRYWRLVCLYGLGEYKQGLEESKAAKILAKDSYYDVLCYYISFLKENELYEEAVNVLVEELSMPYIPYQYETKLNEAYDELLLLKQEANAVYEGKKKIFSDEEIELYFAKGVSEDLAMMLIEQLAGTNIRRYLGGIRQFLKNPERSSFEKSLILEVLKDQEVDEELEIRKHGHIIEANPIYLENVLESTAYEGIGGLLEKVIEHENPSLFAMCLEFLEFYLYDWYPMLEVIEDYEATAAAIHYYLAALNALEEDEEELCYQYGTTPEAVNDVLEIVQQFQKI